MRKNRLRPVFGSALDRFWPLCYYPGHRIIDFPMGLPGHRRTSSHKRRRAAHFALKAVSTAVCSNCKAPVLPHRVCEACGWYKGRLVDAKASRRLARAEKNAHKGHVHAATPSASEAVADAKAAKPAKKASVKKSAAKSSLKKGGSGDK